nr:hypothetical protein [Tanacetum cinerariifolium]
MVQQSMRSEVELCPTNKRFKSNKSNRQANFWNANSKGDDESGDQGIKGLFPRRSKTITFGDNVFLDTDEAFEYIKLVNTEETQQRETERRSKQRHARIVLERQVNKEVDRGYQHLKVKLKAKEQPSHGAQLPFNLKRQTRESLNHSDSFDSSNDGKTKSERDSDHEESNSDYEHGDESDKSDNDDEGAESKNDESDKHSDDDEEQTVDFMLKPHDKEPEQIQPEPQFQSPSVTTTSVDDVSRYLNDIPELQMTEVLNAPLYTKSTTLTVTPLFDTIQETQENPAKNVIETPPATPPTRTKKKRAKTLLKKEIKKKNDWKKEEEIEHEVQSKVLGKLNLFWFLEREKELLVQRWFNELVDVEEEPEANELINGSVVLFGKCKKKFPNKDNITKEELKDNIDWANPKGNRFHLDMNKPLTLVGPPGRKKIPISYFSNYDLEYLMYGNEETTYALLVTKINAARYKDKKIEEMIPYLWSPSIQKYKRDVELGIHQ